ncbi:MAG TPA: tRNA (N6-isopentenyl adenosine(37)-C2)-methylthiotransferase MiaB [Halanaerobiaceae bacterium]|jgi:tRNA-2-methylthio-N6-dimethylallyladenosine synthase|nr:tRNA (N6-isopentenyl adenosine(37)-C2)-methylthiotransferase MiaB [Bacillota bacterium]HHU92579.1 tRNA (N6-isopentenyl adenosine(37)-C2)-methylthiotransferase MiaB [Halanaerobiaceae bacterium]HOA41032.1 tRNA (N6-isopentenyl adenosine(37)-C2)-methylthiotransferase MiaB [Halanaerobiales bacterium]HPZ63300.1 tRNA (N6-isopentenyl adenosine(37)-C2)-methylthiotransferase MiaB [Halanaerobiales bacterium]HQD04551.1 tRNA (N6-isopentenyl adenosine(37)-C2)-methylthiotransferase MiaB [Halanaerobiales ba
MKDKMKKYFIITYGCQMNEHDSEKLAGMLEAIDYHKAEEVEEADIILINTCTIRENAELRVFGKVGELKRLKENNPDLIIGVGGCMMQSEKAVRHLYEKHPQVDLIFGTHNIHHVPDLIKRIEKERSRIVEVWDEEEGLIPDLPSVRESDFKAWVSIIQGCNNFCTYCVVPYVRGRERSRPFKDIINEVEKLVAEGVKEITLLGQNVNSYGKDFKENIDFADLLQELDKIPALYRLRYMTSHPRDFSFKLIQVIKDTKAVCEHFHLPIQSGSNRILKKMNRGYSREKYLELVNKIRQEVPEAAITTDIIVGFPGETEEDFQETIDLVKEVRFDSAFTFIYSPRTGTPASKMEEQIPEDIKKERLSRLMALQNQISLEKNQAELGKVVEVLIEGESKNNPETLMGRDRRNKLVIIPKKDGLIGEIVNVRINKVQSFTLYGEVV